MQESRTGRESMPRCERHLRPEPVKDKTSHPWDTDGMTIPNQENPVPGQISCQ